MSGRARGKSAPAHPVSEGNYSVGAREALPMPSASCIVYPRMHRLPSALVLLFSALAVMLSAEPTRADTRTSYLIEQLKSNDDYRVRTQAALALGASGEDVAVKPLCDALGDSNTSVKVAAAAALGKLGKSTGLPCLQSAEKRESTASVKTQIQKSIASLQNGGGSGSGGGGLATPPPPGADTKVYVAIQITNKTSRPASEIETIIRSAMQTKLLSKAGTAVAPKTETPAQGGQIVKSKKLKGFLLLATVESPVYSGGNLSQVVRVSMWTYPEKALQGEFSPKLTQSGTSAGDIQSENTLMKLCVENAIETFQKVVASM